jgi:regulator of protease activity HflC (stomatin/prohibitin superfamily)
MKRLELTDEEQRLLLFAVQQIAEASIEAAYEKFEEKNEETGRKMLADGNMAQILHEKIKYAEEVPTIVV